MIIYILITGNKTVPTNNPINTTNIFHFLLLCIEFSQQNLLPEIYALAFNGNLLWNTRTTFFLTPIHTAGGVDVGVTVMR